MAKVTDTPAATVAAEPDVLAILRANAAKNRQYVKMHVPPARPGEEQSIYVGINGHGILVPRGKTVSLPKYVAEHLAHVLRAEEKYERDVAKSHQQPDDHINRMY